MFPVILMVHKKVSQKMMNSPFYINKNIIFFYNFINNNINFFYNFINNNIDFFYNFKLYRFETYTFPELYIIFRVISTYPNSLNSLKSKYTGYSFIFFTIL